MRMQTATPLATLLNRPVQPNPTAFLAPDNWDAFVLAHPHGHLLQTSAWGNLKARFGWRDGGVALFDDNNQVCAGALLLYRRVGPLTLAYAPKGPLTDWHDHTLTAELLLQLRETAGRAGAALLKIEPDLPDTPTNRALLRSYGLQPSAQTVQPRSTVLLDITGADDAILGAMKSKWRYNIRLANRKDVTVREAANDDLAAIHELMQITGERDGFAVHNADYYTTAYQLFVPRHGVYLLAEYAGQPLAAIVVCAVGKTAYYLWGASSDRERNRMPNHALQWAGIQWAKSRGATDYDFWGIPDALGKVALGLRNGDGSGTPSDDLPLNLEELPAGELWGVYRFKQGFGGRVVRTVGAWDLPIDPLGYRFYIGGLAVRDKVAAVKQDIVRRQSEAPVQQLISGASSVILSAVGRSSVVHLDAYHRSPSVDTTQNEAIALSAVCTVEQWRASLAQLPDAHVLQSWEWGAIKAQTGWQAERFVLGAPTAPIAAFQLLWRQPLPYLPLRVGYVSKGPLLDWANLQVVDQVLLQIEEIARQRNCILVKVDPDVRADSSVGRMVLHALQRRGWRYSNEQIQFKNTGTSNLTNGEEALLAGMKSKWRYNVRLAEKRGINVRRGTIVDLPAFYRLYAETGARDGFLIRPFDYYRTTWETFLRAEDELANPAGGTLLLAEHPDESEPLAGLFLFRYGAKSWYFYGASSERRRRDMPNYLLQWEALRWSLAHGCRIYDWWGAPTNVDDANDSMQGVWQFKQGFGAELQTHIGAWDFPVSPLLYRLYQEAVPHALQLLRRLNAKREHAVG
ncbi:MAG: peptidoglycan bridge formation glycyltransferase FemA/FemB family protein [Caldilineaceae bacterium]